MEDKLVFTEEEMIEVNRLLSIIRTELSDSLQENDEEKIRLHINNCMEAGLVRRDVFGLNPILLGLQTAIIAIEEIGLRRDAAVAIMLYTCATDGYATLDEIGKNFGSQVVTIIQGLQKVGELYKKTPIVETENFVCRRHARYSHNDCRPCEHNATDSRYRTYRGTATSG